MKYKLYKAEDFKETNWSGGKTKQLAIFPEDGNYLERDFLWRLSTATITEEESRFSKLPDYNRVLVVLEGEVVLAHEGQRVTRLKTLEQDRFDGSYKTKSFGKITDYNLMVSKGNEGYIEVFSAHEKNMELEIIRNDSLKFNTQCFYCKEGYFTVSVEGETILVTANTQLVIEFQQSEEIKISIMGDGVGIRSQILYDYKPEENRATVIPTEKASFTDFITCMYIANVQFRGAKYIFRNLKNQWFDEELKKVIRKIEKPCIPFIIAFLGIIVIAAIGSETFTSASQWLIPITAWLLVNILIISPMIYFVMAPKPVKKHIKDIHNLTPYEEKVRAEELATNERLDKILSKYKFTGRAEYDENGNRLDKLR